MSVAAISPWCAGLGAPELLHIGERVLVIAIISNGLMSFTRNCPDIYLVIIRGHDLCREVNSVRYGVLQASLASHAVPRGPVRLVEPSVDRSLEATVALSCRLAGGAGAGQA